MAIIQEGILGGFSGKVGTVVGGYWRGIYFMRALGRRTRTGSPSPEQEVQAAKFGLLAGFLATMRQLIDFSFKEFAKEQTGRNYATRLNFPVAFKGEYPNLELDFPQMIVSKGTKVVPAKGASVVAGPDSVIDFQWVNNSSQPGAKATDRAILIVHSPSAQESQHILTDITRNMGPVSYAVPYKGDVHTWLAFCSEDGKYISTSVYTGMVTLV